MLSAQEKYQSAGAPGTSLFTAGTLTAFRSSVSATHWLIKDCSRSHSASVLLTPFADNWKCNIKVTKVKRSNSKSWHCSATSYKNFLFPWRFMEGNAMKNLKNPCQIVCQSYVAITGSNNESYSQSLWKSPWILLRIVQGLENQSN